MYNESSMKQTLTLNAIKQTRRFDGTLFQNWKHSMELMFEFKELKDLVDVSSVKLNLTILSNKKNFLFPCGLFLTIFIDAGC